LIDLRSDTVTLPTPEMREAIARAELGDDVYGEDPTVNRLEAIAAATMGKEAALLVASGTMGNLIALLTHSARGTKAIVGAQSHTYCYEAGGASALGGIFLAPIRNTDDGELDSAELKAELTMPADDHFAEPSLVVLENTHNRCGGAPIKLSHMAAVREAVQRKRLPVHLDGARIFNAAVALETSARISHRTRIPFRSVFRKVWRARSGRFSAGARTSSRALIARANCWAAECGRRESSRRRESSG